MYNSCFALFDSEVLSFTREYGSLISTAYPPLQSITMKDDDRYILHNVLSFKPFTHSNNKPIQTTLFQDLGHMKHFSISMKPNATIGPITWHSCDSLIISEETNNCFCTIYLNGMAVELQSGGSSIIPNGISFQITNTLSQNITLRLIAINLHAYKATPLAIFHMRMKSMFTTEKKPLPPQISTLDLEIPPIIESQYQDLENTITNSVSTSPSAQSSLNFTSSPTTIATLTSCSGIVYILYLIISIKMTDF